MNELTQHDTESIEGGSWTVPAVIIAAIVLLDNNWADIKQGFADGFNDGRDWATGKATEENDGTC
jgi:hypothetical protein